MIFPPDKLEASKLYTIPVVFVAVALYVTEVAPWQRDELLPIANTGVPTVGVIITV
jgi:energy-converting hydrogenase Eha subunit E